ncbi:hypothetical protein GEMRC1_009055 [Eukaryota sp. GEM-RC1]
MSISAVSVQTGKLVVQTLLNLELMTLVIHAYEKVCLDIMKVLPALQKFVQDVVNFEPVPESNPELPCHCISRSNMVPYPTECQSIGNDTEGAIDFKIYGKIKRIAYWGVLTDSKGSVDVSKEVVVLFTPRYCFEAHYYLSNLLQEDSGERLFYYANCCFGLSLLYFYFCCPHSSWNSFFSFCLLSF